MRDEVKKAIQELKNQINQLMEQGMSERRRDYMLAQIKIIEENCK